MPKIAKPESLTEWIILLAATGIILTSPYGGKAITGALKEYLRKRANDKEQEKLLESKNVSLALYRLKRRKQIRIVKSGAKTIIKLTERGRKRKLEYDYEQIRVPEPKTWDKKWRLLMFDIPHKIKQARDTFRWKLKDIGFIPFQKSIWIYPYSCEDEIDFIAEYLRIAPYITLLTVQIENDSSLKEKFRLH